MQNVQTEIHFQHKHTAQKLPDRNSQIIPGDGPINSVNNTTVGQLRLAASHRLLLLLVFNVASDD